MATSVPHQSAGAPRMGRVAGAALAGTTIEFYDFFIFGTATALVFGSVFFTELGGARGTLALGATYAVAFVARPIGAIVFGHVGDRLGRKRTLIYTLSLMGLSTFAIGLIPSYDSIGIAAPVLLVTLRFLQGLAVGGEWAGAVLLTSEYAPPHQRGRYAMFPQLGPSLALALSAATFLLVFELTGNPAANSAFQDWGWRIPFLASIALVVVGLYVRLQVEETPVFRELLDAAAPVRVPVRAALAAKWREILLVAGAIAAPFAFFYIASVFVTGYAGRNPKGVPPGILGLSAPTILVVQIVAAAVFAACCACAALCSDRMGRRRLLLAGNLVGVPVAVVAFPIMERGGAVSLAVGMCLLLAMVGICYGPAGAYIPELFNPRYRYTGAGLGYNLGGVLGGAVPIIVAAEILDAWGSDAIGIYLASLAVLSTLSLLALPETRDVDITEQLPARSEQTLTAVLP